MSNRGKTTDRRSVDARRRQAVWLSGRGWTAAEIGVEMRVSERTVERYLAWARENEQAQQQEVAA